MPDILRNYEKYPGIGVNWVLFGPNGHIDRPSGLVMDNYITTLKENDSFWNCHIKSVIQPKEIFCMSHPHYALYKHNQYASSLSGEIIDNYSAFLERTGKAFTSCNHRSLLRINHYITKSMEDLREKCDRGYPNGAPNANFESQLRPFDNPLVYDYNIQPYAELVRDGYTE